MTETTDTPRNESGQFTPAPIPTEGLFGQELANAEAGFTTKPRDDAPESELEGDAAVRAAAEGLASRRQAEANISVTEIMAADPDRPANEAQSVEQAGAELANARVQLSRFAEGIDLSRLADTVDAARAEAVAGDKDVAKHYGLDLQEAEKPESKVEEVAAKDEQVDPATAAAIDAVEGLDETTKRALKIPQVRAAIEQQLGEVESARQQLATDRALAMQFSQAAFVESFPELAGLQPAQLEAGLQFLAQNAPQRFQQALGILNRVSALQAQTQQVDHARQQEQRQHFEASVLSEDVRLAEMFGGDKTAAEAANAATISYLADHGIPRHQMVQTFMANPVLSTAEARRTIWEASEYRRIKELPRAVPQNLPPVQRPSTIQSRPSPQVGNIKGLQAQLEGASGMQAVRLAGQIKAAQRKARG
jgi:hypothetical protein